jgi:hypothetical protein
MESLMKADIFFFVTTVAVIAVTICLVYAGYYLIRILRNVEEISEEVKAESQLVREDIGDLRDNIREEGMKVKHFTNFFSKIMGKRSGASSSRARKEKAE